MSGKVYFITQNFFFFGIAVQLGDEEYPNETFLGYDNTVKPFS